MFLLSLEQRQGFHQGYGHFKIQKKVDGSSTLTTMFRKHWTVLFVQSRPVNVNITNAHLISKTIKWNHAPTALRAKILITSGSISFHNHNPLCRLCCYWSPVTTVKCNKETEQLHLEVILPMNIGDFRENEQRLGLDFLYYFAGDLLWQEKLLGVEYVDKSI